MTYAIMVLAVLLFFILIGLHIPFAIGLATFIYIFLIHGPDMFIVMPQIMFSSVDVFAFLAVPAFILVGNLMSKSGITDILVNFVRKIIGFIPGGLAHMNILASIFFAGISGSALADAASLGPIEISMMTKGGYTKEFSGAVTAASAVIGPIIPPSIVMVIYALIAGNVSIGAMFIAGYIPGLLMGVMLMVLIAILSKIKRFPKDDRSSLKEILQVTKLAIIPLMLPVFIIGSIVFGITTATEAAIIGVVYALVIGLFVLKTLKLRDLPEILLESAKTTGVASIMITMAKVLSWFLAEQRVVQTLSSVITAKINDKNVFLALLLLIYILIGCILDNTSAMALSVPILLPISLVFGINPLQFGIITNLAMCIGLITPPVGQVLFITCRIADVSFEKLSIAVFPFLLVELLCLLMITFIPQLSLFLPQVLGFIR